MLGLFIMSSSSAKLGLLTSELARLRCIHRQELINPFLLFKREASGSSGSSNSSLYFVLFLM